MDFRLRTTAAIKQAVGGYNLGNVNSCFDDKKPVSNYRVWIGKSDVLPYKVEWESKPAMIKEKLSPGIPDVELSGSMSIHLSKWDEEVAFEIPKPIKSKFGVK